MPSGGETLGLWEERGLFLGRRGSLQPIAVFCVLNETFSHEGCLPPVSERRLVWSQIGGDVERVDGELGVEFRHFLLQLAMELF